jgi:transcriptional regulator with XRE-family HTH domain
MAMIGSSIEGYLQRMKALDVECLAEIKRQLNKFRFDPAFRGQGKRVPLRQFAKYCGVSRQTLYDLLRGDRKGIVPETRDRIMAAFALVNDQGLRFKRVIIRKPVVERRRRRRRLIAPGLIEWQAVMPNGAAVPPMPRRHLTAKTLAAQDRERAKARARRNDQANL